MPGFDGTGPNNQGPLTGRGLGPCGRGLGFRRGFGRGFGRSFGFATPFMQPQIITEVEEKELLQEELEVLKQEMQEIQKRLKEIK